MYPPTVNVANLLSKRVNEVVLIGRHLRKPSFSYSPNIQIIKIHPNITDTDLVNISRWKKILYFKEYIQLLKSEIKKRKPSIVICHDMLAAFAYWIGEKSLKQKEKPLFWYHNHDVIHDNTMPAFSVLWFGKKFEKFFFNIADIFSLPVEERKQYFPLKTFKGRVFIIPNYPTMQSFDQIEKKSGSPARHKIIRLIYQGSLGRNHGFSELIRVLKKKINGYPIELTLIGQINSGYKEQLISEARQHGVSGQLHILDPVSYRDLTEITRSNHIGLAIHVPNNRAIHIYGATSSNKIYEYMAQGLPVILYDTPHYRKYLNQFSWTKFVDLSEESLIEAIEDCIVDYEIKSQQAMKDFQESLNYEKVFFDVWDEVSEGIK